jgi:hypothetical protein
VTWGYPITLGTDAAVGAGGVIAYAPAN